MIKNRISHIKINPKIKLRPVHLSSPSSSLSFISLGTGSSKVEEKCDAHEAVKWGILSWLTGGGHHLLSPTQNEIKSI
jgi:hypothetical protein